MMSFNEKKYIDASAGTGKTHWIVENKLVSLHDILNIQSGSSDPFSRVLIVTYTEKATGELRDRIRKMCNEKSFSDVDIDAMHIFTIHSFCQHVLHDYFIHANQPSELSKVDGYSDAKYFVDRWIRDYFPTTDYFTTLSNQTSDFGGDIEKLSSALAKAISLNDESMLVESVLLDDKKTKLYYNIASSILRNDHLYEKWKSDKASRKVQTYNDLIISVRTALEDNPKLLNDLKSRYDGVIIDEFQDTNHLQWDIFKSIFNDNDHFLYVVGDPKQSIFSFQGSDLYVYYDATESIKNKEELKFNWRSSKEMITACNSLFCDSFFDEELLKKRPFIDSKIPDETNHRPLMALCGKTSIEPFWFPNTIMDPNEFAVFAVDRIMFCQENLEVPDKYDIKGNKLDEWKLRKLTYKDFAVLARTRTEMIPIERELKKRGIPYSRYKDKNLFNGFECQHWISLLNAIDSDDFTSYGRKQLNEALFSVFFNVRLELVSNPVFDSPAEPRRRVLLKWHNFAIQREWTRLIESIYDDSHVEMTLSDQPETLGKIRQIGKYILDYLNANACSLADVSKHLSQLTKQNEENDNNLVEKRSDDDCVQIMTIHSSKGLEFPVVIPVAGFKKLSNSIPAPFVFHDENKKSVIGFTSKARTNSQIENINEWRRLFYVAYTRAKNLMIIPRYTSWIDKKTGDYNKFFDYLASAISNYYNPHKNSNEDIYHEIVSCSKETSETLDATKQIAKMKTIIENVGKSSVFKHSYSSLAHKKEENNETVEDATEGIDSLNNEEEDDSELRTPFHQEDSGLLAGGIPISVDYDSSKKNPVISTDYPVGKDLGEAVHQTFERTRFNAIGAMNKYDDTLANEDFVNIIKSCFADQHIQTDDKRIEQTAFYVWNTLNAKLPAIVGNKATCYQFSLAELKDNEHFPELEFNLNPKGKQVFHNYCNGFIDLLFVRNINDKPVYSILDWKTDTKESDNKPLDYSDAESLKRRVDAKYAIQRVLYSYSLIKWLKTWYGDDENVIFNEHFGGMYYVFIRGCHEGTGNGIYAHTWDSWSSLEKAFNSIAKLNRG